MVLCLSSLIWALATQGTDLNDSQIIERAIQWRRAIEHVAPTGLTYSRVDYSVKEIRREPPGEYADQVVLAQGELIVPVDFRDGCSVRIGSRSGRFIDIEDRRPARLVPSRELDTAALIRLAKAYLESVSSEQAGGAHWELPFDEGGTRQIRVTVNRFREGFRFSDLDSTQIDIDTTNGALRTMWLQSVPSLPLVRRPSVSVDQAITMMSDAMYSLGRVTWQFITGPDLVVGEVVNGESSAVPAPPDLVVEARSHTGHLFYDALVQSPFNSRYYRVKIDATRLRIAQVVMDVPLGSSGATKVSPGIDLTDRFTLLVDGRRVSVKKGDIEILSDTVDSAKWHACAVLADSLVSHARVNVAERLIVVEGEKKMTVGRLSKRLAAALAKAKRSG